MNSIETLLSQLRQLIALPKKHGRPTEHPQANGRAPEGDHATVNRLMMVKIGWTLSFLMFLASFAQDGNHVSLFEKLLNTCSVADMILAIIFQEKWSVTGLSRWDEAIMFATISMGLRLFS